MNILSKTIFSIAGASLIIFLLFATYLSTTLSEYNSPKYEKLELGLFEVNKINNNFSVNKIKSTGTTNTGSIFLEKINISDKILYSTGSIEIEKEGDINIISITSGIYIFDFKELNSNYIIKGKGFEINNRGPGKFIVNNLDIRKSMIFSISTLIDLNLKNIKTNEKITSLDLFPHTYLVFNPNKNIFVKNSDFLKISQTFLLGYFESQIFENETISEDFLKLTSLRNDNSKQVINHGLLLSKKESIDKTKNVYDFLKATFGSLPGESLINNYSDLFVNQNKKSSFYKNIIIRNLHELIASENINKTEINKIVNNIKTLKEIDEDSAIEIKNIITYYYEVVLKSNLDLNNKINISELYNNLNNKEFKLNLNSLISLENIFLKYDFINSDLFYKDISEFKDNYFKDLKINLDIKDGEENVELIEKTDYLLYFLENLLLTADFSSTNIDTKDLIKIFNDYVELSTYFYKNNDDTTKRTGIYSYSKILKTFLSILENKYFYEERNENLLLELKEDIKIVKDDIFLLEKNINNIFSYYNKQTGVLDSEKNTKDKFIIKLFTTLEKKYTEYFTALNNYNEYIVKYDKSKTSLLTTNTVNENNKSIILSKRNAIKYLQTFNGVVLSKTIITVMDYNYCLEPTSENEIGNIKVEIPYCYKVENLIIDNNNISLLLYPLEKNKIEEIIINNVAKSGSYKLDHIQKAMDEKMKTESKDKDKYDFKNYLLNTFGQKVIKTNENNQDKTVTEEKIEEDTIVKVFKRNKLLGKSGDFANISEFLEINYKDLIVERNEDNKYSIFIAKSEINIDLGKNNTFYGDFVSNYDFHTYHSFINPKIKLIDKRTNREMLAGKYINIEGNYGVNSLKEEIKEPFKYFGQINHIVNSITNNFSTNDIKITYIKSSSKITFDIQYKGSNIYIELNNENVTKVNYNNINQLSVPIKYITIDTILNNIKK